MQRAFCDLGPANWFNLACNPPGEKKKNKNLVEKGDMRW